ncbi:MAG: ABC transporter permease [Alphaproteobacteria bacterium]
MAFVAPVILTLIFGSLVFLSFSIPPLEGLFTFFIAPISSVHGFSELLVKATPLTLIAGGLVLAFRSNTWNIGAEGQFTLGAIAGCGVALFSPWPDSPLLLPTMILAAVVAGAFWAGIVALLRAHFEANEILSSLMLVYVAQFLLLWLVQGPWRDPHGFNFPETRLLQSSATLPLLVAGTRLHAGVLFAIPVVVCLWLVLYRSLFGFQLRVVGTAPRAARFAGFSRARIIWLALCLSGALAGLAGVLEVSGVIGQLVPRISPGYGFTAIIVAFLGGLHPLGVVAAALLVALTYLGAETAQILLGLPHAAGGIFQGLLLFTVLGCGFVRRYRIRVISHHG